MATFNETGSGGIVITGGIRLTFIQSCLNTKMLLIRNKERLNKHIPIDALTRRAAAFLPNIVHCRQPNLRGKIFNKELDTNE